MNFLPSFFFLLNSNTAKMVTEAVVNSTVFQASEYISCYLSMPQGELDTAPLVSAILAAGSHHLSLSLSLQRGTSCCIQERSFTSQSSTPRTRLTPGWTCSACTTSLISIHSRQGSGVSVSPRTRETVTRGRTVGFTFTPLVPFLGP